MLIVTRSRLLKLPGKKNVSKSGDDPLPSMIPSVTKVMITIPPPTCVTKNVRDFGAENSVLYSARSTLKKLKGCRATDVMVRGDWPNTVWRYGVSPSGNNSSELSLLVRPLGVVKRRPCSTHSGMILLPPGSAAG